MGDMGEVFSAMREAKRERHEEWKRLNMAALNASEISFTVTNYGETICFREQGKPRVDFYPSTGRWRVVGSNSKAISGGAHKFLDWYKRQRA